MKKRWWILGVLIIVIIILIIIIISNKYVIINTNNNNQILNDSNNPVFTEKGICGACGDICTFGVERMDCPESDGSFECKVINGKCTKILLNNSNNNLIIKNNIGECFINNSGKGDISGCNMSCNNRDDCTIAGYGCMNKNEKRIDITSLDLGSNYPVPKCDCFNNICQTYSEYCDGILKNLKDLVNKSNYCSNDSDCIIEYFSRTLGCSSLVNKNNNIWEKINKTIAQRCDAGRYANAGAPAACIELDQRYIICKDNRCIIEKYCMDDSECPIGLNCWARCNGGLHCATPEEISTAKPCEPNE